MASKKNVQNLNVHHSEATRDGQGNLKLMLLGRSPKYKATRGKYREPNKINASIPFNILPYVMSDIRKAWLEERARRLAEIADIDSITLAP